MSAGATAARLAKQSDPRETGAECSRAGKGAAAGRGARGTGRKCVPNGARREDKRVRCFGVWG